MSACKQRIQFLVGLAILSIAPSAVSAAEVTKPNIVVIVADDLGWSDVGYHRSTIATPNLDKLASEGVKLEQFYVQPLCTPTRASLMTGRYPIRYGLQVGVIRPWANYGLPLEERTLPQALGEAGYTTAITGKWHLGHITREYLPTHRGFDHQYGLYNGAMDYWKHVRDGSLDWHRDDHALQEEGYSTDLIAAEAVRIVERQSDDEPLFLYVPFNAPHAPLQAKKEYLERYSGVADEKRRTYSAMVATLDDAIGRVIEAVDRRGWRDRTLFVFSSDNGGPLDLGATNGELRDGKASVYEGGVRVPAFLTWRNVIPAGSTSTALLHMVDLYPTLIKLAGGSLEQTLPLDGRDAWPTLLGRGPSPRDEILHQRNPGRGAIRVGDWKLVVRDGPMMPDDGENAMEGGKAAKKAEEPLGAELFNIATDPFERANVADQNPAVVEDLQRRLAVYAAAAVPPKGGGRRPSSFVAPKVWGEPEPRQDAGSQ